MNIETQIHPAQAKILRELLFKPKSRFSELNVIKLTSDHFTFHLNKLLEIGLIEKTGGMYSLSVKGKEFANRMDTDTAKIEKQAKTAVLVVGVKKVNKKTKYLVQQRLKEPYYGFYGFISGKVKWGEKIMEAAKRELIEESGFSGGEFRLVGTEHKIDIKGKAVQEDKFFYVIRVDNPKGNFIDKFEGGRNLWLGEEEIKKLAKKFDDLPNILSLVKKNKSEGFTEKAYLVGEY